MGLRRLSALRQNCQTFVVVLTSHTTETEIIAALVSGADAYCIKGASVDRLLQRSLRLEKVRPT